VKEVAPGPVGAISGCPVFLACLGFVLGISDHFSQLFTTVGELALVSVDALGPLLVVPADFRLVSRIGPVRGHQFRRASVRRVSGDGRGSGGPSGTSRGRRQIPDRQQFGVLLGQLAVRRFGPRCAANLAPPVVCIVAASLAVVVRIESCTLLICGFLWRGRVHHD